MSDWKERIEAQIADLRNSCYLLDEHGAEIGVSEHAATMHALLDVAVAVENNLLQPKGVIYLRPPHPVAIAHKKLREASDD